MDRTKYAYNYLIKQGLSPVIASGIVGNLQYESGLNTTIEGDKNLKHTKDGSAFGLAQWRGDRFTGLKSFAQKRNKQWDDFDTQLDYVIHELNTTEKSAYNKLKYAKTPEEASDIFMRKYERPSKQAIQQSGPKRAKYARTLFGGKVDAEYVNQYQNNTPSAEVAPQQTAQLITPELQTMEGVRRDEVVDLSFAEKVEEAKQAIQQYQTQEDLIAQMPMQSEQTITPQQVEQRPNYDYLFNQDLFKLI